MLLVVSNFIQAFLKNPHEIKGLLIELSQIGRFNKNSSEEQKFLA